jgi:NAD(P)-dependent dehydrogenase (short-subunit alcohol dehydrogenase family)
MASSTSQVVHSAGIYHGLPTYGPEIRGLTAVVTGANGVSGYHMVKVLAAAPNRWEKIYCASRRPPPDYFFDELSRNVAGRVEHLEVDFLADPKSIAESLKRVEKV